MAGREAEIVCIVSDPSVQRLVSQALERVGLRAEFRTEVSANPAHGPCASDILGQINEYFLRSTDDEVFSQVLDLVLKALNSEIGILGYIDDKGQLVCPSLTRHVWDRCQMPDKRIAFRLEELGGALAEVLQGRKTVTANHAIPTPPGHLPIERFLGVPLVVQNRLVGALFVANKPTDYTPSDIELAETVARFVAPVLDARVRENLEKEKRAEYQKKLEVQAQQLARRNRQLECLASLSELAERGASIEEMVELTSYLLAGVFQDVSNVYSRIIFRGQVYQIDTFEETEHKLSAAIFLCDEYAGAIEICCPKELLQDEGFGIYRMFVNELAERLSAVLSRRKIEEEIHAFRRQTELVLEMTRTGLSIVDEQCRLIYVDPWRRLIYGDYQGKTTHEYFCGTTKPCWACPTARALQTKRRVTQERIMAREGNRPVQTTAIPFLAPDGKWYVSEITVDLTERKRWEERLIQAERLETIGQLAETLAHEINTPLQYAEHNLHFLRESWQELAAILKSRILTDEPISNPPSSREINIDHELIMREFPTALDEALDGVKQTALIVKALRDFAQPGETEKTPQDLNAALQTVVDLTRARISKYAQIVTEYDPELPHIPLLRGEFGEAIANLLIAASKAIEQQKRPPGQQGSIVIRTRFLPPDWVEVRITDNGLEIPPEDREHLFDPWSLLHSPCAQRHRALAHVHRVVVELHQGTVELETNETTGTTIVLRLPTRDLSLTPSHTSRLGPFIAADQMTSPSAEHTILGDPSRLE